MMKSTIHKDHGVAYSNQKITMINHLGKPDAKYKLYSPLLDDNFYDHLLMRRQQVLEQYHMEVQK